MVIFLFWLLVITISVFSFSLSYYLFFFKVKRELTGFKRGILTLMVGLLLFALIFTAVMFVVWPPVI
ncbi:MULTISPECIES: hypothetical protein [Carboxydothermus]|uniref:Membrane protein n=2 Tax=Carboxydothermus TaxID=129957 RepID=A0ABX2R7V8_9THEO|nr:MULTISPECIES: hypothetical protein [Carboxydothermus]ABB14556.1 putative membrane protein [Carboxydothermus hydrogenoformans Z-2901]NYE57258.1 putative membrane protein [Carboxydothermus ferrireducens DSM 11255]